MRPIFALPICCFALAGCLASPDRPEAAAAPAVAPDDPIQRLEQRLSELERRVNTQPPAASAHAAIEARQQPAAALQLLVSGNAGFVAGRPRPVDLSPGRIGELSAGQKPYAVIIGCADSRVPPEHLFGAGLGDLFVIRIAGNVIDESALASVEYAVAHTGCRLVVMLGHTSCGAVTAAVADAKDTPAVAGLVARIRPAVNDARHGGDTGLLARAITGNAMRQRDALRSSQLLAGMERDGEVALAVATYDLSDGSVDWLDLDGLAAPGRMGAMPKPAAPAMAAPAHH
jgi:carbonic anhydrase